MNPYTLDHINFLKNCVESEVVSSSAHAGHAEDMFGSYIRKTEVTIHMDFERLHTQKTTKQTKNKLDFKCEPEWNHAQLPPYSLFLIGLIRYNIYCTCMIYLLFFYLLFLGGRSRAGWTQLLARRIVSIKPIGCTYWHDICIACFT